METHGSFDSLALTELAKDGLVRLGSNVCEVTEMGRGYLRNICAAFDLRRRHRGRL